MKIIDYCVACGSYNITRQPATIAPFVAKRAHGWAPAFITVNGVNILVPIRTDSINCRDCNFLFCDWRFDDDEMGRLYHDYRSPTYAAERDIFEPGYKAINDGLGHAPEEVLPRRQNLSDLLTEHLDCSRINRVLDFGGDQGQFIPDCLATADRFLFDISDKPPVEGIVKQTAPDNEIGYDLVMCCHVLEHCAYPREVVKNIKHLARPYAYFEVPLEREESDNPNYAAVYHEHINKFDERSLTALLQLEGFHILETRRRTITTTDGVSRNLMALCSSAAAEATSILTDQARLLHG